MQDALVGVWESFRTTIWDQLGVIERATTELLSGRLDGDMAGRAQHEAHKLAGSLGTFGLSRGTELAREIENSFEGISPSDTATALRLADATVQLRNVLQVGPGFDSQTENLEDRTAIGEPFVLVVDDDPEFVEGLRREVDQRGWVLEAVDDARQARSIAAHDRPEVVLVDTTDARAGHAFSLMSELRAQSPPVPAVVLTRADSFTDLVEAARLGAKGFVRKPISPAQALASLDEAIERSRVTTDTVLVVDDDPAILAALQQLLEPHNKHVVTVQDPGEFWEVLPRVSPDLVVLDVAMPKVNGVELCQVLRSDARWARLPVVFLTASTDAATVQAVFAAGADDYMSKPIVGSELVARILSRLERSKMARQRVELDPLTGTASLQVSVDELKRFVGASDRTGQTMSIATIDVDGMAAINESHGYLIGNDVLRWTGRMLVQFFDAEDTVGRWAGQEFVVGMFGMSLSAGVERTAAALERLRRHRFSSETGESFEVSFSAGVAVYPGHAADLRSLHHQARLATEKAKELGGNRVVPVGWRPEPGTHVDVVVVDDDSVLAGVLQHALTTRALSTSRFEDGSEAAVALQGPDPKIKAKVVLLDWGLPSLDGLRVLKRLADTGVLGSTRVIMLTARDSETEVLQALDLGAFDHVAKPFSVPVLMRRVHRAMEL